MTRIVRTVEGIAELDASGRKPGRGTYICSEPTCRDPEQRAAAIKRALGAQPAPGALEFEVNHATK
jgi:predicted RNA-binding protein YlxR (DUF448 family)